jgi:hypothetical protein
MNGSIIIPEKFKLRNKTITVVIDDDYLSDDGSYGEADFTNRLITVCGKFKGKKLSKKDKEATYFHELIHMILHSMDRHKLKYDEKFVEDFAQLLYEYEKTKQ